MNAYPSAAISPIAAGGGEFFLGRQAVLDRQQRLFAHELLFRSTATGAGCIADQRAATSAVITHAVELGVELVAAGLPVLLNVDADFLHEDSIELLPPDRVILEILESVEVTPTLLARVANLHGAGFRFALDDIVELNPALEALLPYASILKLDVRAIPVADLPALTSALRHPGRQLLAEKVETAQEFEHCLALGFDYFQGYHFAKPAVMKGRKISPSQLVVLELLQLIDTDADPVVIERAVKRDPAVGVAILRLANSPAAGAGVRIGSIGKALALLGRRQLKRWLQIVLYAAPQGNDRTMSALMQLATTRAKFAELLMARRHPVLPNWIDGAFTVGMLSVMDALFGLPMAELLERLDLGSDISDALLHREGRYGEVLQLVEMAEQQAPPPHLEGLMAAFEVHGHELARMQLAALQWAGQIGGAG